MFWRFGFSSTSTLDTLLDRPNVTLEEVLDEDELLQECKTQNSKLVNYLQQPRVLKRLFEHVVGTAEVGGPGGREWEEKVRFKYPYICSEVLSSDIWSIVDTSLDNSEELLVPFWEAILSRDATNNPPTITQHQHPLFASDAQPIKPGTPSAGSNVDLTSTNEGEGSPNAESSNVGVLGLEVKPSDEGSTVTSARDNGPGKSVLAGYWAKVNGVFLDKKPREMIAFIKTLPNVVETFVAHMETPAVVDLLYRIIQCEEVVPNIGVIDWLSSQELMPRLIDLLSPSHSADMHSTVSELLKAVIALSAPSPASLTQNGGTEAFGFGGPDSAGAPPNGPVGGVNNRLVRELASEVIVRKMVGFMLDASLPSLLARRLSEAAASSDEADNESDVRKRPSAVGANLNTLSALKETPTSTSGDSAIDDEDEDLEFDATLSRRTPLNPRDTPASEQKSFFSKHVFDHHRDSTATIRPSSKGLTPVKAPEVDVTPESCTSTLVTCIGVLIELIRKNNSDYFEQHLFHTLRTHLLQRQQEIAERKANRTVTTEIANDEEAQLEPASTTAAKSTGEQQAEEDEDDEMEGMEEAMAELSDKLGIVHLGPMLNVLCDRLPDFQQLIAQPRVEEPKVASAMGRAPALTFERYRITELYAELLHCSNMALLNRAPNEGPQYSDEGVLLGGIEGLQVLARTLQGTDGASESGQDHDVSEKVVAPSKEAESDVAASETDTVGQSSTQTRAQSTGRGHTRQSSTVGGGGNGSEDTDDEALLSEVSLSGTNDTDASAKNSSITNATTEEGGKGEEGGGSEEKIESVKEEGEDDDQAEEIKSVLSHMSLADLTSPSPAPSGPPSPIDEAREYVVGDKLKKKFLEHDVIPTIMRLFFDFPWNNFLHNVVYDILQQFFNGRMDVGLNRRLTLAVFDQGQMTEKIIEGHKRNEESLKSPRRIRMGYMGHMHLIAEETVKLLERYPQEIGRFVQPHMTAEWDQFVNETLKENREKEAAPLAGGRPQMLHSLNFAQQSDADGDLGGAGASHSAGSDAFASYLSSQMGGGVANSSDDDDSDEDTNWLSHNLRQRVGEGGAGSGDGFEDSFAPDHSYQGRRGSQGASGKAIDEDDDDDDDDWGPFADSSSATNTGASSSGGGGLGLSSAQSYLTPADWAADFQREQSAADEQRRFEDVADDASSTASPIEGEQQRGDDEERSNGSGRTRSDSSSSDQANGTPFVDLLDNASIRATDVVAAAHARRPSLEHFEGTAGEVAPRVPRPRASSSGGSSDRSAGEASHADEPLGPGIAPDAQPDRATGLIERTIDGETVKVPLDDVALMSQAHVSEAEEAIVDDE